MKIEVKGLNSITSKRLLDWAEDPKNKNECYIKSREPVIIVESFKDSAIKYMLKNVCKRLKIPVTQLTDDKVFINTLKERISKKVSENLNADKRTFEIEVIYDE